MTSSNGNIFRVTGHLCGEFTDHRWIPHTKASDAELLMFSLICARIHGLVNNREVGDFRRHRAHYGITVMCNQDPVSHKMPPRKIPYSNLWFKSNHDITVKFNRRFGRGPVTSHILAQSNNSKHKAMLFTILRQNFLSDIETAPDA